MSTRGKLIHVAKRLQKGKGWLLLLLRQESEGRLIWLQDQGSGNEEPTAIVADNAEEALRLSARQWRYDSYTPLHCGSRFSLPERDEIGNSALFHQMIASYSSMNGVYFDEELGHLCIVHNASQEALKLWKTLAGTERL